MKKLIHQADYVVYQSEFCKQSADRFLGQYRGSCTIANNPVNTAEFIPSKKKPVKLRLLLTGSHHHFYRVEVVIKALAILQATIEDAELTIAGRYVWKNDTELAMNQAKELAAELNVNDSVHFLGEYTQSDAIQLYQDHSVLIHSKYNDPCPRVVAEALSCGIPLVYSASGGVPELVGRDAGIGIEAPLDYEEDHPPSPDKLSRAIAEIWDEYEFYWQAARKQAESNLDVGDWLTTHEHIFSEILR